METAALGRTGIEVPRICVGAWQAAGWSSSDDDRFVRTVEHAMDRGLNFIDTAEAYGRGHSEELVARAPSPLQDQLAEALQRLPADEQATIASALDRVVKLMEVPDFQAAPMLESGPSDLPPEEGRAKEGDKG